MTQVILKLIFLLTVHSFWTIGALSDGNSFSKWQGSFLSSSRFSPPNRDVHSNFLDSFVLHTLREIPRERTVVSSASKCSNFLSEGDLPLLSAW